MPRTLRTSADHAPIPPIPHTPPSIQSGSAELKIGSPVVYYSVSSCLVGDSYVPVSWYDGDDAVLILVPDMHSSSNALTGKLPHDVAMYSLLPFLDLYALTQMAKTCKLLRDLIRKWASLMAYRRYGINAVFMRRAMPLFGGDGGALSIIQAFERRSALSCGWQHSVVVDGNGIAFTWGSNSWGECCQNSSTALIRVPQPVHLPPTASVRSPGGPVHLTPTKVARAVAGYSTTLFLTRGDEPRVLACGRNHHGEIGRLLPYAVSENSPIMVRPILGLPIHDPIIDLAAGDGFSVFVTRHNGDVWGMGQGLIGCVPHEPRLLPRGDLTNEEKIIQICAGQAFVLAITNAHRVMSYGWESDVFGWMLVPMPQTSMTMMMQSNIIPIRVQAGRGHGVILMSDGSVWSFGESSNGELGLPGYADSPIPTRVPLPVDQVAINIAAGHNHTMVLCGSGTILTFGLDVHGQLAAGNDNHQFWSSCMPRVARVNHTADNDGMVIEKSTREWRRQMRKEARKRNEVVATTYRHHHHVSKKKQQPSIIKMLDIAAGGSVSVFCTMDGYLYVCGKRTWCGAVREDFDAPNVPEFVKAAGIVLMGGTIGHGDRIIRDGRAMTV